MNTQKHETKKNNLLLKKTQATGKLLQWKAE